MFGDLLLFGKMALTAIHHGRGQIGQRRKARQ